MTPGTALSWAAPSDETHHLSVAELSLWESREQHRRLLQNAPMAFVTMSAGGEVTEWNAAAERIFGWSRDEAVGRPLSDLVVPPEVRGAHRDGLARYLATGSGSMLDRQVEMEAVRRDGSRFPVEMTVTAVRSAQQVVFAAFLQDITKRRHAEDQLRAAALSDPLTALPNRLLLVERLKHAMAKARRGGEFAVLFLDLDRFKLINDSLGHPAGDELLVAVADRIRAAVRPEDTVARLGGDEFAVLLAELTCPLDAIRVAERIAEALAEKIDLSGYDVYTSCSIGIVYGSADEISPERMLRSADMAMYRAKRAGAGRYEVFDRAMHAEALRRLQLETDLRHALERGEFRVFYQPVIDLANGRVTGLEALVRWQHPDRGLVSPADFIPAAEETGLILPLGEWVLREVCRQIPIWRARYQRPLSVAVNLSVKQFAHGGLAQQVERALADHGTDPATLKLEITESVVIDSHEQAARTIEQLRALGVEVHMDDFGTGYSSLAHLHQLPLDALKIDRSFIMEMKAGDQHAQMVRTILALARAVGLTVVAEGVNTLEQMHELRTLGCEYAQGFLFSAPIAEEDVGLLLDADPRW